MDSRLKLIEKLKLQLSGHIYVGEKKLDGWKEPLPFYTFKCPIHGYVTTYAMGHNKRLVCPLCIEELLKEDKDTMEQDVASYTQILNETT